MRIENYQHKFARLFKIFFIIALLANAIYFSNIALNLMPLLPIPGHEPGKYDHFLLMHAPGFFQVIFYVLLLLSGLFLLPGALILNKILYFNHHGLYILLMSFLDCFFSALIWAAILLPVGCLWDFFVMKYKKSVSMLKNK